jgi:hypothetical protein
MPELPQIPAAQNVAVSPFQMPFQPMTTDQFLAFNQQLFNQQLQQRHDIYAQTYQAIDKYGEMWQQQALDLDKQFMPQYAELYTGLMEQANPQFMDVYNALGGRVQEGLASGYELGAGLTHEMQQAIRAGQTARGNWIGNAPLAQEAFGMGEAAINLYNMRLGQAQNFLSGRQPSEFWGQLMGASKYGIWDAGASGAAANQALNPTVAPSVFGTVSQGLAQYNATAAGAYGSYIQGLIGAAQINNQSAFDRYSAQFDQFLYKQSVQQGLFSQPQVSSGGGGAGIGGAIGGAAIGAVGAAAAGAAAAICWVARKVIPDRWREFRHVLFTKAPAWFRQKYVTYGRRYSEDISSNQRDIERIRRAIERCLQF